MCLIYILIYFKLNNTNKKIENIYSKVFYGNLRKKKLKSVALRVR